MPTLTQTPFSVPHGPAGAPRTTGGQILYGALQPPPQNIPWLIAEVRLHQVLAIFGEFAATWTVLLSRMALCGIRRFQV